MPGTTLGTTHLYLLFLPPTEECSLKLLPKFVAGRDHCVGVRELGMFLWVVKRGEKALQEERGRVRGKGKRDAKSERAQSSGG